MTQANQSHWIYRFTLECIIDGSEPITVTWLKDQSVISSLTHDIQYERGLATLTLVDAQRDDSGYYTCRANNGAGTVESSAYLIVQGKMIVSSEISSYTASLTHLRFNFRSSRLFKKTHALTVDEVNDLFVSAITVA